MKHNIRINGEIKQIDCELGTDTFDKNGVELIEGDIVKVDVDAIRRSNEYGLAEFENNPLADNLTTVVYQFGEFVLKWDVGDGETWVSLSEFDMYTHRAKYLEVVGHVAE